MSTDVQLNNPLTKWSGLESWKLELAHLVIKAYNENKYLKCNYQGITFSPKGLAKELINNRFVWGVVNWNLIEPINKPDFGDPKDG